jgi:beta-phosphoglucomutase-like phosphatase (HAD superfamily)
MVERMMAATSMTGLIDFHVSGCEVAAHKPAPDIYRCVMERMQVSPDELAVVEDSPTGIAAGVASGAHVVALSQFVSEGCDQSAAHEWIAELRQLEEVL